MTRDMRKLVMPQLAHQAVHWQIARQQFNGLNLLTCEGFQAKKRYATICSLQLLSTSFAGESWHGFPICVNT